MSPSPCPDGTEGDRFDQHQWVLKRKRSFETALHISPRKKACDIESPDVHDDDDDKHIDKKRRVVGPEVRARSLPS